MHLPPAPDSERSRLGASGIRRAWLGGRQEVVGEQVEEAGKAHETCQDSEPQRQVLQGALQLRVQEDDLAFGDAPLPRVV